MPPSPAIAPWTARRWVRVALGLVLLGLCSTLALSSAFLPYLTIQSGERVFAVGGAEQTANLHLVLVTTGTLGALTALSYALSRRPMPIAFFAIGGIALGTGAFLCLDTYHHVSQGWIRDPAIYAAIARTGATLRLGSALTVAMASALGILLGAVLVLLLGRAAPAAPNTPRRSRI